MCFLAASYSVKVETAKEKLSLMDVSVCQMWSLWNMRKTHLWLAPFFLQSRVYPNIGHRPSSVIITVRSCEETHRQVLLVSHKTLNRDEGGGERHFCTVDRRTIFCRSKGRWWDSTGYTNKITKKIILDAFIIWTFISIFMDLFQKHGCRERGLIDHFFTLLSVPDNNKKKSLHAGQRRLACPEHIICLFAIRAKRLHISMTP